MFSPFEMTTIEKIVEAGKKLDLSHSKLHIKSSYDRSDGVKVILNYTSIIDKYYDFIQKVVVELALTDDQYMKYRFQPKRLCYELYGTTELWSIILRINNMSSALEFTKQNIKVVTSDIFDVLNEITILEEQELKKNRISIYGK